MVLGLGKPLKDVVVEFVGNPGPVVDDSQPNLLAGDGCRDLDRAFGSVFESVLNEVSHDAPQVRRVDDYPGHIAVNMSGDTPDRPQAVRSRGP